MTIPLIEEDKDIITCFGVYEKCHFCKESTKYWHENTNNPVCPICAKKHKVKELPDFGQRIRKNKRKQKRKNHGSKRITNRKKTVNSKI